MGIETIAAAPKSSAVAVRRPENGQETVIVQNARFEEAEIKKKAEAESQKNVQKGTEPPKTPEKEKTSEEDVKAAAEAIKKVTSFFKRELEFETDKDTNQNEAPAMMPQIGCTTPLPDSVSCD